MKQLFIFLIHTFLFVSFLAAQNVGINNSGDNPDASAMLDVQSTTKGMLVPRMSSTQRINISSPAIGLLVFDTGTNSFWFFNGTWTEFADNSISTLIADADADTKIQVEETADEDIIRFDLEGAEKVVFRTNSNGHARMEIISSIGNLFIGTNAGQSNTSGFFNTFIGDDAGQSNTSGLANTFIGRIAGQSNTTGVANTFIGRSAGFFNTSGNSNTFIGQSAGQSNTTGGSNTFIGQAAGLINTTGAGNVFLGNEAGRLETGSNKLYIDNSETSTPLIYGDFATDELTFYGNAGFNFVDSDVGLNVRNPSAANSLILNVESANGTDRFRVLENGSAGFNELFSNVALTVRNPSASNNTIFLVRDSDGFPRFRVTDDDNIFAIGLPFGDHANMQYRTSDGRFFYDNSSRRYKRNIQPLEDDFSRILQAQPKTYTRPDDPDRWEVGYIAEEMDSLGLTKLVSYDAAGIPDGFNYEKMILYVNEVLKEQVAKTENLEKQQEAMQSQILELNHQNQQQNKQNSFLWLLVVGLISFLVVVLFKKIKKKLYSSASIFPKKEIKSLTSVATCLFILLLLTGGTYLSAQNVGINTTNPDRPLSILGTGTNSEWISFKNSGDNTTWHINSLGGGLNFVETGVADARLFLVPGGNAGFNFVDNDVGLNVRNPSATNSLIFNTESVDGTDRFTVTESGNVGFNHVNPIVAMNVRNPSAAIPFILNVEASTGADRFRIMDNGNIQAREIPFGDHANMQYRVSDGQFFYDNSSRRYKRNIQPLKDDFHLILKAQPKIFTRPDYSDRWEVGYIAEEMDSLGLTKLVSYDTAGIPDGFNYEKMILYVNEILKTQQADLESKEQAIADLKQSRMKSQQAIADLQQEMEALKAVVFSISKNNRSAELPKKN